MAFMGAWRDRGAGEHEPDQIGASFKEAMSEAGDWHMYMYMQGETVPKESNQVYLSREKTDQWGIPLLVTKVGYDDNDERLLKDFITQGIGMFETAGIKDISHYDNHWAPGRDIHEMGGCRMGKDPQTSLLNKWNQLHHCKNVFVTDGACMASTGNGSPSILNMAFTARAANYAVQELKKGNI
jgi:choline dehydrogenase-like flavoprotein